MSEKLQGATQENVLTLLCFDEEAARIIVNTVSPSMFENKAYRTIAEKAFSFFESHGTVPKEHIADEIEEQLQSDDKRESRRYVEAISEMFELSKSINREYVLSKLSRFIKENNLKGLLYEAVELVNADQIDEAQALVASSFNSDIGMFNPGVFLNKGLRLLNNAGSLDEGYHIGIDELDERGMRLARKEILTFMAASGRGKTWFLCHLGKSCLLQGAKILHVTLEVSERVLMGRYLQTLFSISKRESNIIYPKIRRKGKRLVMDFEALDRPSLDDPKINKLLRGKIGMLSGKGSNLLLKEFPMRGLTMKGLRGFLETLNASQGFVPDVVLVDYPDLFHVDPRYKRVEIGQIYEELRGMATTDNFAMGVVTQANRQAAKKDIMTGEDVGEDYSKYQTADNFLTYNQTDYEANLGLARLYVDKARNETAHYTTLLAQSYDVGQFALGSTLLTSGMLESEYPVQMEKLNKVKESLVYDDQ